MVSASQTATGLGNVYGGRGVDSFGGSCSSAGAGPTLDEQDPKLQSSILTFTLAFTLKPSIRENDSAQTNADEDCRDDSSVEMPDAQEVNMEFAPPQVPYRTEFDFPVELPCNPPANHIVERAAYALSASDDANH